MPEDRPRRPRGDDDRLPQNPSSSSRLLAFSTALVCVWVFCVLALFEGAIALTLKHPDVLRHAPPKLLEAFRSVNGRFYRSVVQAEAEFMLYDPELGYTLKPTAAFTHANSEYVTRYRTNRLGLRDSDEALRGPEVVVLGDSFAMGWGVAQDRTFPKTLERLSGLRTLNAGVSSYGTVRELKLLDRIDTSAMKYLVIQYCDNDYEENGRFYLAGNNLIVSSPERYQHERDVYERARRYFFGKYLVALFRPGLIAERDDVADQAAPGHVSESPAGLFLNALLHAGRKNLQNVRILLFELRAFARNSPDFIESVQRERKDPRYPQEVREITLLSFHTLLGRNHYYVLDDHLTPSGHDVVARALTNRIRDLH